MLAATIGIAFGSNSDITPEAADAVILETSLAKVEELIYVRRECKPSLSLTGIMAAAQEIIDFAAMLNAVRFALPFDDMADFEDVR